MNDVLQHSIPPEAVAAENAVSARLRRDRNIEEFDYF